MLAAGLQARGGMYSLLGIYGKALADLLEARRLFAEQELDEASSQILQDIGITYRRLGYPDKAREYLNQAIAHEKRVGDTESLYISALQLGYADQETGQYESALATQQHALELANATGDRDSMASANLAIASVLIDLRRSYAVSAVDLTLVNSPTAVSIYVTDDKPTGVAGLSPAQTTEVIGTTATVRISPAAAGRYVVVWLTALPQVDGEFRGTVAEVGVTGSPRN